MNDYITRIADNALEVSQVLRQASTGKKNAVLTELARLLNENRAEVKADGTLAIADRQGSIHRVGAEVQGKAACNGDRLCKISAGASATGGGGG